MSKFISLVMAPYSAPDLHFSITYWLSPLRGSMYTEKSTFPRLPIPTFSIQLFFLFYVSVNDTMRNLGFTKSCHFYPVNALDLYPLLRFPVLVRQSFLGFCIGFPSHLPTFHFNPTSTLGKHLPEVCIYSYDSPTDILSWVPTTLETKLNSSASHKMGLQNMITTYNLGTNSRYLKPTPNPSHFKLHENL